jgi:hypothetical protein
VRAEIRYLHTPDIDPANFVPDDPERFTFDWLALESFFQRLVSRCTGADWHEVATKLGRSGHHEEEACARVLACAYIGCQRVQPLDGDHAPYYQTRFWARVGRNVWQVVLAVPLRRPSTGRVCCSRGSFSMSFRLLSSSRGWLASISR